METSSLKLEKLTNEQTERLNEIESSLLALRREFFVPSSPKTCRLSKVYIDDLQEIAENVDLRKPIEFRSHRRLLGPFVIVIKKVIQQIAKPFLHVCFKRQIVVNDHVLGLSQKLANIEDRLNRLENDLRQKKLEQR